MVRIVSAPRGGSAASLIKVSPSDASSGSLSSKITGTNGMSFNVVSVDGVEQLQGKMDEVDGNTILVKAKRKTPSQWAAQNPTLALGEIGIEYNGTEIKFKIGNGAQSWNNLPYQSSGGSGGGTNTTVIAVSTPVLECDSYVVTNTTCTLYMSAVSLLNSSAVATYEVSWWDGTVEVVNATGPFATSSKIITGTTGSEHTVSVVAVDLYNNRSLPATRTVTVVDTVVTPPSITSPAAGAIGQLDSFTITSSPFAITNGTGNHTSTDWEIWTSPGRSGTRVWNSTENTTSKTSIMLLSGSLQASTTYYIAVRYNSDTAGSSGWRYSSFTTGAVIAPNTIGQAYGGGFYAGVIRINNVSYALIVAPKSTQAALRYKTTADASLGAQSVNDGWTNSNALNNSNHPAAQHCRSLTTGGYTDWYLPSRDEIEICYRYLKPGTYSNHTGAISATGNLSKNNGSNPNSDPVSPDYTTSNPAQTGATAFRGTGAEAYDQTTYWTSTEYTSNTGTAITHSFYSGQQIYATKTTATFIARAVRRVKL